MTDNSEDTGSHRSGSQRRGISKGPIIALVAIVVVIALVVGWFELRDAIDDRNNAAAESCVEGNTTLDVTADPDLAAQIKVLADRYNATEPVVRDHCVSVAVNSRPTQAVQTALAGTAPWDAAALGPQPALWIPQSTRAVSQIPANIVDGDPRSVAFSQVVLAMPTALAIALRSGNIGWQDLPRVQTDPNSLAALGLPTWGSLRMAMPTAPDSDSTLIAAEAVGAAAAGSRFGPLSEDTVRASQAVAAISALAGAAPKIPTAADAVAAILAPPDAAIAPAHAVATTEQRLATLSNDVLTGYAPSGSTVVVDFPATLLSGPWVDETQNLAAAMFVDYLVQWEQMKVLQEAGFQVGDVEQSLQPAPAQVLDRVAELVANPVLGTTTTALLDVSTSMSTRLQSVVDALKSYVSAASEQSSFGIWTYSRDLDVNKPYKVDARTEPLVPERKKVVDTALNDVRVSTSATDQAYPTLVDAYTAAVAGYVPGRTNSIVLITDGPEDDSALTGQQLLDAIAAATDPARPIRVDVVVLGDGSAGQTLQSLTDRTGGSFTRVPPADLGPALTKVLGN